MSQRRHVDGLRNFIASLAWEHRYNLPRAHQCKKLALYPVDHPSGRQFDVDWSEPDIESFPEFVGAKASEEVLQVGDTMYLSTNWFRVVSSRWRLKTNMQVVRI